MDALYEHNRAGLAAPLGSHLRPSWRGRTHMAALFAALPAFIVLIVLARDTAAKVGVVIYGVGVCAMFAVSTTYHRWVHSLRARSIWQRADHATIYAAIAGTSTPIFLVTMPARWSVPLLTVVWSGALAGVLIKSLAFNRRRTNLIGGILYLLLGWLGVLAVPFVWHRVGVWPTLCLLGGGGLYTVGAVCFAVERPKLRPSVFGYHEVWHLFTIGAAASHLVAVWAVVT